MPTLAPAHAADLIRFIDASPSPWHAVRTLEERLAGEGFVALDEAAAWQLQPGGRYYVVRGGSSLIAFIAGRGDLARHGIRLCGAHTDSPGLRVKPRPVDESSGMVRIGVEIYGGPLLATFADRDLGLAGRVSLRGEAGAPPRLVHLAEPVLRLPNLAIHMNREVNEAGLRFNKQTELPLTFATSQPALAGDSRFRALLGDALGVPGEQVLTWDLAVCDTQGGRLWGSDKEFIASPQLDNLASCHAILHALLAAPDAPHLRLAAFFDHEEVGSESAVGAGGSFLTDVLARLAEALGETAGDLRRALSQSFFVSCDMAHAWNPNFPAAYEPGHRVLVNGGPVIKCNANQRYTTGADTAARFIAACEAAGVPWQQYAHRSDLGCGSTIGPILAARLGIPSVDVGAPMWAMHSLRESAGVLDHHWMTAALAAVYAGAAG